MVWDRYLRNATTLSFDQEKCIGCGMCVNVCTREVFLLEDRVITIVERDNCIECGACMLNCPVDALWVRAGVGCASGMIRAAVGIKGDCCCTPSTEAEERPSCCGEESPIPCCGSKAPSEDEHGN